MDITFPSRPNKQELEIQQKLEDLLSGNDESDSDAKGLISLKKRDVYSDNSRLIYIGKLLLINKMYKSIVSELKTKHNIDSIDDIIKSNHKHNLGNYQNDYKALHPDFNEVMFNENKTLINYQAAPVNIPSFNKLSFLKGPDLQRKHLMNDEILYLTAENKSFENSLLDLKEQDPSLIPLILNMANDLSKHFGPVFQQNFIHYVLEEEDYIIERVDYDLSFDYEDYFVDDLERYSYDCVLLSLMLENSLSNILDNIPEFDNYILDIINDELSELDYEQDMENAINQMEINRYKAPAPFRETISRSVTKRSQVVMMDNNRVKNITSNYMPQYNANSFKRLPSPKMMKSRKVKAAKLSIKNKAYTNVINRIMEHLPQYDAMIISILKNEHDFINRPEVKAHMKELIQSNSYNMQEPNYPKANYSHILKYEPKKY